MSYADSKLCNRYGKTYSVRRIKLESTSEGQSLIKVEKDSQDDTKAVSTHDRYIKQEEPEERTTVLYSEQIVVKQESSDTDVPVKVEIEIGPTVIQPQYIGSSLHTTDASKAELIQCGGADVALGTTIPGAASHRGHSTGSRSVVHAATTGHIEKDLEILKSINLSATVEKKPFACNICEYKSDRRTNLVRHMRTHTGYKPFSCNICEYKCAVKSDLVKHTRTHTGVKRFSCNYCEYKCVAKGNLMTHIMCKHTGDKSFSCHICDYKCKDKSIMVLHIRTHTGEKPFACNFCEYKCVAKGNLMTHIMRKHTGDKSFSCDICEYKCTGKYNLVTHMRTHRYWQKSVLLQYL